MATKRLFVNACTPYGDSAILLNVAVRCPRGGIVYGFDNSGGVGPAATLFCRDNNMTDTLTDSNIARKVRFKTLGCRLNQAETGNFSRLFLDAGWTISEEEPDAVVLHSCAVTRTAERETFRFLRILRREHPTALIAVTGCAAACNSESLFREAGADIVVAAKDYPVLPAIIDSAIARTAPPECGNADSHFPVQMPFFPTKRALLKVQDGCSFSCAYCIVPQTRGPSVSRKFEASVDSAEKLLESGFREIVVTGCNLACYRDARRGLSDLVDAVCSIAAPYGARVRLGSLEPGICDDAVLSVMRSRENLCRFLHYPVQTADPDVLKAMKRCYTADYIGELLARVKKEFPLLGLGADFITGLPGEDERAFEKTCEMVAAFEFANVHVFPYSPRQGTKAPRLSGCPSRTVAKRRAEILRGVAEKAGLAYRRRILGKENEVLVEGFDAKGRAYGWSGEYIHCRFSSEDAKVARISKMIPRSVSQDGTLEDAET